MPGGEAHPGDSIQLEGLPYAGEVIAGKYQIERVIGAGGMGVVVYARHLLLNQPVAVKFLHPNATLKSDPVQRFLREARAAAALRSEHVARVLDVGTLNSGDPFMVMEYLEGSPLSRVIRKRAPLSVAESVDYMLQACDAVGEAHRLGIVHRDLKPGNLFITKRPNGTALLKVLDFGISKNIGDSSESELALTATHAVMGSPQYASPEQLRSSKNVDTRTDIWSLGVILYYMLTGRRPFEGETISALCYGIAVETPPTITSLRPELPPALNDAVMRCLEKDREKRFQDVATLVEALRPFAPSASQPVIAGAPGTSGTGHPVGEQITSAASTVISNATTEPQPASLLQPATMMTRSAWAAPQVGIVASARPAGSRTLSLAIQIAAATAVATGVLGAIYLAKRGGSAEPQQQVVEAVTPAQVSSAKPPAEQPPAKGPIDPVIDESFAPTPTLAAPPPQASAARPPPAAPTTVPRGGYGIATKSISLFDSQGAVVGRVPKGGRVKVARQSGEWSLVIYASNDGLAMGWGPSSVIVPAP